MDPLKKGEKIKLKGWWSGRFWYIPISTIIMLGLFLGVHLTFFLYFDSSLHQSETLYGNADARFYLHLYGAGVIGGSLYASYLFARDANEKIYTGVKLPTIFDCLGYFIYIIGSGITGLVFYFLVAGGVIIVATNGESVNVKPIVAGLLAFTGGYSTDGVKRFVRFWFGKIISTNQNESQGS